MALDSELVEASIGLEPLGEQGVLGQGLAGEAAVEAVLADRLRGLLNDDLWVHAHQTWVGIKKVTREILAREAKH